MIYVYGIAERGCTLPAGATGIDDMPPTLLAYEDISAVVSEAPSQRVALTEANLWRHEKLIEGLMEDCAVLPACYGTVLKNEQEMLGVMAANRAEFVSNLECVRGRVELSVRVVWDDVGPAADEVKGIEHAAATDKHGSGYMRARLQEDRQQRARRQRGLAQVERINATLASMAIRHTQKTFITPRLLLTAAYLVECKQMGDFRNNVAALAAVMPGLQFLCTGPWPPFSFVDVKVKLPSGQNEMEKT